MSSSVLRTTSRGLGTLFTGRWLRGGGLYPNSQSNTLASGMPQASPLDGHLPCMEWLGDSWVMQALLSRDFSEPIKHLLCCCCAIPLPLTSYYIFPASHGTRIDSGEWCVGLSVEMECFHGMSWLCPKYCGALLLFISGTLELAVLGVRHGKLALHLRLLTCLRPEAGPWKNPSSL